MSHLILFQRILQECITTNNIRPEYEMWLTQEVYPYKFCCHIIYHFLTTHTPDEGGWVYWFLYKTYGKRREENSDDEKKGEYYFYYDYYEDNNEREEAKKHLQLSVKCNHKYAICEEEDSIKILEKELEGGNGRAAYKLAKFYENYASLFSKEKETSLEKSKLYIGKGVMLSDFCCVYDCMKKFKPENVYFQDENETQIILIVHSSMLKWGYHYGKYFHIYRKSKENYKFIGENLIHLGIPCGYFFNSDYCGGDTMNIIQTLDKGKSSGCSGCANEMRCLVVTYDFAAKLIRENERLKQLQTLSLEDCVKNVISEYI